MAIAVLLIVLIVAYFHYVQGLFSATISAICSILAAIIAISYHETVIAMLLKGAVANYAQGMILCALYAITYVILRVIFDKSVPGNVRFPVMVDKVGSGAMGLVAGLFGAGIMAMAAQTLPFGPSIAGYSRYEVRDRPVTIKGARGSDMDSSTFSEMKEISFEPAKASGMFIPVDDLVIGVVNQLSSGALSNEHPLASIHPDWLTELFGQRAGVQLGTKHVLLNLPSLQMVNLKDVYKLDSIPEIDGEVLRMRETPLVPEKGGTLKLGPDEALLITRVSFDSNATDEDGKARVSCAAVRLVGWREKGDTREYLNYTPIGTLEDAAVLLRNKPDDPLIVASGKAVDFAFKVAGDDVFKDFKPKTKELDIKQGVFVEVKRMAQMDLSGTSVKGPPVYSKDVEVIRKPLDQLAKAPKRPAGSPESSAAAGEAAAGPIEITAMKVSDKLFSPVNPGTYDAGKPDVEFAGGSALMHEKKFEKLKVAPQKPLDELKAGDFPVSDLFVPDGKKMVQVSAKPIAGKDSWGWINLSQFELVESGGNKIKPNGAFARVKKSGSKDQMLAQYDAQSEVGSIDKSDGRPYDIWIVFNVPAGSQITQLQHAGKPIYEKGVKVP